MAGVVSTWGRSVAGDESREAVVRQIQLLRQLLDATKAKKRRGEADHRLKELSGMDDTKQARKWARDKLTELCFENPYDDRGQPRSIRTVSGGLPTLGKRHR